MTRVSKMPQTIGTGVIAARMQVTQRQVCHWIHDGELSAIDIKRKKAKRSTYRVLVSSFRAFLVRRGLDEDAISALVTSS